ncbi:protein of unknown function [Burkholderia multivorans]
MPIRGASSRRLDVRRPGSIGRRVDPGSGSGRRGHGIVGADQLSPDNFAILIRNANYYDKKRN